MSASLAAALPQNEKLVRQLHRNDAARPKRLGKPASLNEDAGHLSIGTANADWRQSAEPSTQGDKQKSGALNSWIVSKWFDLFFVCGLAPWLLGFVTCLVFGGREALQVSSNVAGFAQTTSTSLPVLTGAMQQTFSLAFVVASLVIGESHQFTSIIRYFTAYKDRKKSYWTGRLPFWFIYVGIFSAIAAHFDPSLVSGSWFQLLGAILQIGFVMFPVVLMQHICAQAKAIGMMYCGRQGFKFSFGERFALAITTWCLVVTGATTIAAPFGTSDGGAAVTDIVMTVRNVSLGWSLAMIWACSLLFLYRGCRRNEWLPSGAAVMWCNLAAWILVPVRELVFVWVCVPLFFHATQHWSVAWAVRRAELEKCSGITLSPGKCIWEFVTMAVPIQAVTLLVLFSPMLIGGATAGLDQTLSVEFSIFVFYLHYFADRLVWRPQ